MHTQIETAPGGVVKHMHVSTHPHMHEHTHTHKHAKHMFMTSARLGQCVLLARSCPGWLVTPTAIVCLLHAGSNTSSDSFDFGTSFGAARSPISPFVDFETWSNLWPGQAMPGRPGQGRPPVNQALVAFWPDRNTLGFRPRWPPAFFSRKTAPLKIWTCRPGQICSILGQILTKNYPKCSGLAFFVVTSAKAKNGPAAAGWEDGKLNLAKSR